MAKEESRQGEFTKADTHDGLRMVCERQLKQENLERFNLEHEKIRHSVETSNMKVVVLNPT